MSMSRTQYFLLTVGEAKAVMEYLYVVVLRTRLIKCGFSFKTDVL